MNGSCHTYEWVISHVWMSHVTRMNGSCHTYEWDMSHVCMSHVTRSESVMSHTCVIHVARMHESCHTYEWVMSHLWMSHVTRVNKSCHTYECESCHTYKWVMSHIRTSRVTMWISQIKRWRTYEWIMLHTSIDSRNTSKCVMSHIRMRITISISPLERCHTCEQSYATHINWVMSRIYIVHVAHSHACHNIQQSSKDVTRVNKLFNLCQHII